MMLPDSEMIAPMSIRSPSEIPPGRCSMIKPDLDITESFGVLIGCTLVDTSDWSASVLLLNPGSDVVVLRSFLCVGTLVPVSAVSVARSVMIVPETGRAIPEHLEDIVARSHPSLGKEGRVTLRIILIEYCFSCSGGAHDGTYYVGQTRH